MLGDQGLLAKTPYQDKTGADLASPPNLEGQYRGLDNIYITAYKNEGVSFDTPSYIIYEFGDYSVIVNVS
jgi:hypothetical protein